MNKRIRDLVIGIVAFVFITLTLQIILVKILNNNEFNYEQFLKSQEIYKECVGLNFEETKQEYLLYEENIYKAITADEVGHQIDKLDPKNNCSTKHVVSNNEQIRLYANATLESAKDYFDTNEVGLINTTYATSEVFATFTNQPQQYLFFAMTENKDEIVGIIYTPTNEGHKIDYTWEKEFANNLEYTKIKTNTLFLLFNQKII